MWKYKFDEIKRDIQANPIIAENKIFLPSTGHKIVSLNAENGKKIWEYKIDSTPARRGLIYNKNENDDNSYIYFCANRQLVSLNTKNGKPNKSFGHFSQQNTPEYRPSL